MYAIVAVDENWGTMGHAVILGRKTLATFPGGRPLPKRRNLILSRNKAFCCEGAEVFSSLEDLCAAAPEDAFVIGGGSVYQALLEKCDTVYVTKIQAAFPADTFFPNLDRLPEWYVSEEGEMLEQDGIRYHYVTYRRR